MKRLLTAILITAMTMSAGVLAANERFAASAPADSLQSLKSVRGLTSMSNTFIPKGQWLAGISGSFSTHTNDDYALAIINGISSEGHTIKVSPILGYTIRKNMIVGVKFAYSRTLLRLDEASVSIGSGDTGLAITADSYYSLGHTFTGAMFWRQYIPFGNNKRFALFTETSLAFAGSQSKYSAFTPVKGTYQTSFSTSFNVTPGLVAFVTNDMAIELNVGVMGITYQVVNQIHNQVETAKRTNSMMSFKINLLSIGIGMSFYL